MNKASVFRFLGWRRASSGTGIDFDYAFDEGDIFTESLDFAAPLPDPAGRLWPGFAAALDALHLASGISYYKALLPPRMQVATGRFDARDRNLFQTLYGEGLGEFSARNGVNAWERVNFPSTDKIRPLAPPADLPRRAAVLIGGGKDSLVSLEILRKGHETVLPFAVNPKRPMFDCATAAGLPLIAARRGLDEKLFALNQAGALNGHVPITAIVSLIALAGAFVYGYDTVVLSNERSAEEGNLVWEGRAVNHQYSKSMAWEALLGDYVRDAIAADLRYVSLLRPLSEFRIAELMAKNPRYDRSFTSCNRAFALRPQAEPVRWCCECPKCRFAFLILAGPMGRQRIEGVFGRNLLDEDGQLDGYRELVGLQGHKPWECVGELAESAVALLQLAERPEWAELAVIRRLAPQLNEKMPDWRAHRQSLRAKAPRHRLPPEYESMLDAALAEI